MTKYNLEEFNAWLEAKPERKEGIDWGINNFIANNRGVDYNFERIEEVPSKIPLTWGEDCLSVLKKWMEEIDERQIQKLSNLLFPNQSYDFDRLKQEISRLKVKELTSQMEKEESELIRLTIVAKNKVGDKFERVIELLLATQKKISENNNKTFQARLEGELTAYQKVLENLLTNEELQILLKQQIKICQLKNHLTVLQTSQQQAEIQSPS